MSKLSQVLDEIRAKIAKLPDKNLSEENTKTRLINPVLRALGWDPENPEDVTMEDREGKYHPPDYVLLLQGKPKLLVEAKRLGEKLEGDKWADKLMGYVGAAAAGAEWIVLTNGDEYHIYNATVHVSSFGQRLFRKVRLTKPDDPTEETLALLSKEGIGDGDINDQWETSFADSQVRAAIEKLFSRSPDSLSVLFSFVNKHVNKGLNRKQIRASLARKQANPSWLYSFT